ncbi:alpha/beta fold hydrolase [Ectothiorhodospira mobilis]|uniref:alpha/beta fold hydrolase n=1 Tax=Ectothiorhodospira mobilis TaxID=195064 RepID=UPI001EE944CD|nr:alpha/beta hydrolase [Ectothiorhodospira mobilis]MCG5535159.1 alpha/beta hydrolase [Ectothiorhodospira mobilis]
MLRWLLILLGGVLLVGALGLAIGPFFIPTAPIQGLETAAEVAPPQSRFIQVEAPGTDGLKLHYLEAGTAGEGPTFVLLHGFTFNAFTWNRVMDDLARQGRVLAYDQVPYGLSAKPVPGEWSGPSPYTKAAALDHLFAFLDAQGVERAVLVGNSAGGTLALEAALQRPQRVEGLILVNPWVYVNRPTFPQWLAESPQMGRLSLFLARQMGRRAPLLELSYAHPERIDPQRRALTLIHTRVRHWDLAWGELFRQSLTQPVNVSDHLGQIRQPALVLVGASDRVVDPQDSLRAAGALPRAQTAVIPDCGHVPQEECPRAVVREVEAWLETDTSP